MIKINEIFYSIQGESSLVGRPTIFIRTSGCHLRCTYCDTKYAYYDGRHMSLDEIFNEIKKYPCRLVCLTGGEPLLQSPAIELMQQLLNQGHEVSLETSGDISCANVPAEVKKIIDIKTPDSGEPGKFNRENLQLSNVNCEFKFVICSDADFLWAKNFCFENELDLKGMVLFSPSHGMCEPKALAEKILASGLNVRLQLQLHKYIWSSDQRGV